MLHIDPPFRKVIDYLDLDSIEHSHDVIYVVDRRLVLRAFNQAWVDFAETNNGSAVIADYPLGSRIDTAFPASLSAYLISAFGRAMDGQRPLDLDYECSSPTQFRLFHQTAYPLAQSAGLVISNHLIESRRHGQDAHRPVAALVDENGMLTQCSNCRKVRDPRDHRSWLWVPEAVEKSFARTSHAICPRCHDFYYPEIEE